MNDVLAHLDDIDDDTMTRLHETLSRRADQGHLLDISYRTFDSPVGNLLLAATEQGLLRVAFDLEGHDAVLAKLAAKVSPRILRAPQRLDLVAHELAEYFAGDRRAFDVPLDLQLAHGFRLGVLRHLSEIGYGHTESYTVVATAAGNPRAVRAVGSACATNPLPVVVPCHRVVRSDGSLGGYAGGLPAKKVLLGLERGAA